MPVHNPGRLNIPELDSDPISPELESAWVLKTNIIPAIPDGTPIGMLLALTYTGNVEVDMYQFSYRTLQSTTVRVPLT